MKAETMNKVYQIRLKQNMSLVGFEPGRRIRNPMLYHWVKESTLWRSYHRLDINLYAMQKVRVIGHNT